jgi:hypothetical protein
MLTASPKRRWKKQGLVKAANWTMEGVPARESSLMAADSSEAEGPFRGWVSGVGIPRAWFEGLDATAVGRLLRRR